MRRWVAFGVFLAAAAPVAVGCDEDDGGEQVGSPCETAEQCYPDLDPADLQGEPVCLDRVPAGYCTHHCTADADCCAVEGECRTGYAQVCAPFESSGLMLCFLSCEGVEDEAAWCREGAGEGFICRSTGGGGANRKVCVPE